jgi:hypothetical protein
MNSFLRYFIVAIVIILSVVIGILTFYPKNIDLSLKGVMYRLDENNFKPVTLNIKGRVVRSITGSETFKGIVDVNGLQIPVPKEHRYLEVPFTNNSLSITYVYYVDNAAYNYTVGTLFSDKKWKKFTILLLEDNDNKSNSKAWKRENGPIISAPSNDKKEGMIISKQLLPKEFEIYFK